MPDVSALIISTYCYFVPCLWICKPRGFVSRGRRNETRCERDCTNCRKDECILHVFTPDVILPRRYNGVRHLEWGLSRQDTTTDPRRLNLGHRAGRLGVADSLGEMAPDGSLWSGLAGLVRRLARIRNANQVHQKTGSPRPRAHYSRQVADRCTRQKDVLSAKIHSDKLEIRHTELTQALRALNSSQV
jgi:hypothetical protein